MSQRNPTTVTIAEFLATVGLPVRFETIDTPTVLPGITVDRGVLVVDEGKLRAPGDLLHEAGHLALLGAAERDAATADFGPDGGYEMGAIAWSWAASCALGLEPEIVFHADGYRDGAGALIEAFSSGRSVGVPVLEWRGLTVQGKRAEELRVKPYPAMLRWLAE